MLPFYVLLPHKRLSPLDATSLYPSGGLGSGGGVAVDFDCTPKGDVLCLKLDFIADIRSSTTQCDRSSSLNAASSSTSGALWIGVVM